MARGTHRIDKHGAPEKEPVPVDGPIRIPAWAELTPLAKTIWNDTVKRIPDGLAGSTDVQMLVLFVKAWDTFLTAEQVIAKEGRTITSESGMVRRHPVLNELESARTEIRRIAGLFGMTPSDRSGMQIQKPDNQAVERRTRA